MAFPISLRGTVFSELEDVDATLSKAERALWSQKAKSVERKADGTIYFRGSFLNRRLGGSVLTVVSWGTIRASQSESLIQVQYELNFGQNILVRGVVTAIAFGFIFFGVRSGASLITFAAALVFWFMLAALDYLLANWMFPRFMAAQFTRRHRQDASL
jgi:hypothetical protein